MKRQTICHVLCLICIVKLALIGGCSKPREPGKVDSDETVRVEIIACRIGPLTYQSRDRKNKLDSKSVKAKEDSLLFTVEILNRSDSKKLNYTGWCEEGNPRKRAKLTDNFGNVYGPKLHSSAVRMSSMEVIGHRTGALYPGSSLNDLLVFELPIDNATLLTLELPKEAFDESASGNFVLRIPTKDIESR